MELLVMVGVVVLPILLLGIYKMIGRFRIVIDAIAVIAVFLFAGTSAIAVFQIRRDGTIFMTNIHQLFDNYVFLISGAYLGIYGIAQLIRFMLRRPT